MARQFSIKHLPGIGPIALLTFAFLYLPIFTLVAYAFNASDSVSLWGGFSLKWFGIALDNTQMKEAAIRSFTVAIIAASIATFAATLAAVATTRTKAYRGLTLKYAIINQPLMVPEIVTAVALLILVAQLKQLTGYQGIGYLIMAHAAFCIPFAYLPIRARLEGMDSKLEAAAADLYATPRQTFCRVTLPILRPGVLAGFMLAFVISLDDVVITEFVKSAGQETLPTYLLGQLKRSITPEINAISTLFLALSVLIVTLFFIINRKKP